MKYFVKVQPKGELSDLPTQDDFVNPLDTNLLSAKIRLTNVVVEAALERASEVRLQRIAYLDGPVSGWFDSLYKVTSSVSDAVISIDWYFVKE